MASKLLELMSKLLWLMTSLAPASSHVASACRFCTAGGSGSSHLADADRGSAPSSNVVPSTDPLRSAVAAASGLVVADNVSNDEQTGGLMTASYDVI